MKKLIVALAMLVPATLQAESFKDKYGRTCINVPIWQTATFKGRPVNELLFNDANSIHVRCTRGMRTIKVLWPSSSVCRGDYVVGSNYTCRVLGLTKPLKNSGRTLQNGNIDFGDPRRWK